MKVSQEKTGDLTALIEIVVEENDYQSEVDKKLKDQRKKMTMPGFRTGQVPFSMVKKMYGTPVKAQEIERVMSENLYKYIDENKIKVLGSPLANDEKTPQIDWDKDTSFTFYFDIALQPEFDVDLKKVKTTLYDVQPTDETLDKFIEDIRLRYGKLENPEVVADKDMLYGHLEELNEDGSKKEGGVDTNATIFVDRIALATIKKKFEGKKKGAVVKFQPHKAFKDIQQLATVLHKTTEEVKEFTSECSYTIDSIQRMNMAEMNQDFFDRAYKDKGIKTEEDFRKEAKEDICRTYKRESDNYFLNKTSEELVSKTKLDLPEEFLKRWMVETSENKLSKEDVEENFARYLDGIKWQLIEGKLAEKYSIEVKQQDIVDYYKNELLPSYFPMMPDMTEEQKKENDERMDKMAHDMLREQEQTRQVHNYLLDRQLTECLKENTSVTTKTLTIDEFIKEVNKSNEAATKKATKKTTKKETK
ncbi:MAG: trigger factor [Bacteroidales bacterium]|nr:trigger factor [Bacteroidales bacterium]